MPKEPTVLTWAWRLKDLMRERGRTGRSVERELGWGTGYMSQILRDGPPALKVEHVLAILGAIGVPAGEFFAGLYGLEAPLPAGRDEVRRVVEEVLAEERSPGGGAAGLRDAVRDLLREERQELALDRDEIRAVVGEIVREELMRLAAAPPTPRHDPADAGQPAPNGSGRRGTTDR